MGEVLAAERDELSLDLGAGLDAVGELHHGLDLFAEVFVRNPEDRSVHHLRMRDQQVLGLLRVDVHPARDDHVRLAIREVQVAVVIDVPHVADGAGIARLVARLRGLVGSMEVLEVGGALEPDRSRCAGRLWLAVLVQDQELTEDALAYGAGMGEPLV